MPVWGSSTLQPNASASPRVWMRGCSSVVAGLTWWCALSVGSVVAEERGALTQVYRFGPTDLSSLAGHHDVNQPASVPFEVPEDAWLVGATTQLIDPSGQPLPTQLMCHAFFASEDFSSGMGWGFESHQLRFPDGYGVFVPANTRYRLQMKLQNPFSRPYQQVSAEVRLQFVPRAGSARKELLQAWTCITGCDEMGWDLAPGPSVSTIDFHFPFSGMVVFMTAHLHRYGKKFQLDRYTKSGLETVWADSPRTDSEGQILEVPVWLNPQGFHVSSEERYRWTVEYDNQLDSVLSAMGALGAFVHPDGAASNLDAARLETARMHQAITQGVAYLQDEQLPSGEFPSYWAVQEGEWTVDSTPFTTGNIVYSLQFVQDERVPGMAQKAVAFLLGEMEGPGLWRYWSTHNARHDKIIPDLDDTSVVGLALLVHGVSFPHDPNFLLRYRTPEKVFVTWLLPAGNTRLPANTEGDQLRKGLHEDYYPDNTPDGVVNAHLLAYFARQGRRLPEVCQFLIGLVEARADPATHSIYYPSRYAFTNAVSKAYGEGASCLTEVVDPLIAWVVEGQQADGSWGGAVETALALNTLFNLGYEGDALNAGVTALLAQQRGDGSWSREKYYGSTKNPVAFGSQTLTTGFALEALAKHAQGLPKESR